MAEQRVRAAIDVGSNSVHVLVARVDRDGLRALRDESELLGLGDVVDREAELPPAAQRELLTALSGYVRLARSLGSSTVSIVATDPFRRAANGRAAAAALASELGEPVHVLSETLEGELTYLGVTGTGAATQVQLVVDIGGGSTEVIVATPGRGPQVSSLPTGSNRLSAHVLRDPPSRADIDSLRQLARGAVGALTRARPAQAVFVGGTATNVARLAPLSLRGLAQAYGLLALLRAAQVSERFGVNERRARQLPAGAALVESLLLHFGLDAGSVSNASLRDGAIIATHRLGEDWPELLSGYLVSAASD